MDLARITIVTDPCIRDEMLRETSPDLLQAAKDEQLCMQPNRLSNGSRGTVACYHQAADTEVS